MNVPVVEYSGKSCHVRPKNTCSQNEFYTYSFVLHSPFTDQLTIPTFLAEQCEYFPATDCGVFVCKVSLQLAV